jgi:DNA-binding SARP family transcriptional activator
MLVRERLLERLGERWFTPVTVLTAPAGYGKTTLVTQALAANVLAPLGIDCWWTCPPGTGAATVLGEGAWRALGGVGEEPWTTGHGCTIDAVAAAVHDALWHRSPQQVALVIDDVHEIPAGSEAASVLAAVVADLPDNAHVVLSGRRPPPLALDDLEREGRLVRLDEAELAFTDDEVRAFAALRGVPDRRLVGCGGWPALAELAVTAGLKAPTPDGAEVGARVEAGVGVGVIDAMAPLRRRRLALLSHLGPFDQRLARAALRGVDDADAGEPDDDPDGLDIDELLDGLPLVRELPSHERSLHPLWQSWLADDTTPAEVAAALRRAGLDLLARGRIEPAVGRLVEAGAWSELGPAIVTVLGAAQAPVANDVLEAWFRQLPPAVRSTPHGRLLAAVARVESDPEGVEGELESCAQAFREAGNALAELTCLVQLGQTAWWTERSERLASLAARAVALEAEGCAAAAPLAAIGRALLYDITDQGDRMLAELEQIPPGALSEPWLGLVSWVRAVAYLQKGDLARAESDAETALTYAGSLSAPLAQGTRMHAQWFRGRVDEVCRAYPALLDRTLRSGYRNSPVLVAAQSSLAHALVGQSDRAAADLDRARAAAAQVPTSPLVDTNLVMAEALLAVTSGDEAAAAAMLEAHLQRHPIGQGLAAGAQRRHLALLYVLVPSCRPTWERLNLGPAWVVGRDLARALLAVREGHRLPPDARLPDDADLVRAHLPPAWAAELAIAALASDAPDVDAPAAAAAAPGTDRGRARELGRRLIEATWPASRPAVAELAAHGATAALREAAGEVLARLPVPPARPLALRLLGPIELRRDGEPVDAPAWQQERTRALLVHLVLYRSVPRDLLAHQLWPDAEAKVAARHLQQALGSLLQVLEPDRQARAPSFFVRDDDGALSLHPGDRLTVDLWDFDELSAGIVEADEQGAPAVVLDRALTAIDLWRGEPVELLTEEWAFDHVEERRNRLARIATRAGELRLAQGRGDEARELAQRALGLDPWLEAAHRLIVAVHRSAGDEPAARRTLHIYREGVHDLGVELDEATLMVGRLLEATTEATAPPPT